MTAVVDDLALLIGEFGSFKALSETRLFDLDRLSDQDFLGDLGLSLTNGCYSIGL